MISGKKSVLVALIAVMMVLGAPLAVLAAEQVTIQGEVNDSYQIVDANGQVYEVADTAQGNALVENHIGEKAKVTGTIQQDQDVKIISVTTFEILPE